MFLAKYIRKGEGNYVRKMLLQRGALRMMGNPTSKDIKFQVK